MTLLSGKEDDIRIVISMLCRLLYKLETIPDNLLLYYPLLCYIWLGKPTSNLQMDPKDFGNDINTLLTSDDVTIWSSHLDDFCIVGCILNFIKKAGDNFINGCDFYGIQFTQLLINLVLKIGEKSFIPVTKICLKERQNHHAYDEIDFMMVMRCVIGLIENNKGKIDNLMQEIVKIVIELLLGEERTKYFRRFLYQVLATMFWYNINGVFKVMTTTPFSQQNAITILQGFQENMLTYTSETEKERILHAINAILSLGPDSLPPCIDINSLMNTAVVLSHQIVEHRNNDIEDDDKAIFDDKMNTESVGGHSNYLKNWYQEEQAKMQKREEAKAKGDSDNVDMSDSESVYEGEEDLLDNVDGFDYDSPMDDKCPILDLQGGLQYLQANQANWATQLSNFLDNNAKNRLGSAFNEASRQMQERQSPVRNNFNGN